MLGFDYGPVCFLSAVNWKVDFPFLPSAIVHETPSQGWLEVVFSLGIICHEFKRLQCLCLKKFQVEPSILTCKHLWMGAPQDL